MFLKVFYIRFIVENQGMEYTTCWTKWEQGDTEHGILEESSARW